MTAGLTEKDFADVTVENAATTGQKLYAEYGITGVRGQVEAGLPAVLNIGLPTLEAGLAKGYDFDRAGGGALGPALFRRHGGAHSGGPGHLRRGPAPGEPRHA